jgi:hypothetical protein
MPAPTATIVKGSQNAARATEAKHREKNDNFVFNGDANLTHTPQFWVGIFNVSDREQRVERPWVHPQRLGQVIVIPACEPGERVSKPFVIPDIVQMREERMGSWMLSVRGADGRFLAQDAINPEDPRGNMHSMRRIGAGVAANSGTNLYNYGVFWITAATVAELVPTDEEIELAHSRLETTYNDLIAEADSLALMGAEGIKQIGNLHRRAAKYFDLDRDWNKRYTRKISCPNCEEPLAPSAAVCTKCPAVINWTRAVALGLRTPEQAIAAGILPAQAENMAPAPKRGGKRKA